MPFKKLVQEAPNAPGGWEGENGIHSRKLGNAPAARNCYLLVCSTRLTMQTNSSIIPTITNVPLGAGFALSKVPK